MTPEVKSYLDNKEYIDNLPEDHQLQGIDPVDDATTIYLHIIQKFYPELDNSQDMPEELDDLFDYIIETMLV